MSNKQIVADLMEKLPNDASLTDIAREIEFIAGVREGFAQLDRGEAEAIVLAKEQHADLQSIDENDGRNVATREGLRFIGLISVLVESKIEGFIASLHDVLREIETETTFFISLEIKNLALKRAGEL